MIEKRRVPRKRPTMPLQVTDAMSGSVVGQLGNLSLEGMMLLTDIAVVDDALYQFSFQLPDQHGRLQPIEVGVHEIWNEPTQRPGRYWAGFRFIDLGEAEERVLREWLGALAGAVSAPP
ncbi:PilZ domain-containing protein [Dokdonella sp.]|uniref:PilZ domain-containing protein n=1 Tax=Dokdonella sp. TaxID=2291710 RepID=UPI001AFD2B52|nr:PilZ domain-containing protein [Dokdonella sp.]MBO9664315.1 PilZ domain-containing protein [Dokdonella sp.]